MRAFPRLSTHSRLATSAGVSSTDAPDAKHLVVLGLLAGFGPLSLDLYLPSVPQISSDFARPDGVTQLTISGCMVGLAVGQVIAGPLSDRLGRRRPLLIGLFCFVVTSALCAIAPSLELLIVIRVLQGLSGAAGIVIARAIVRDLYDGATLARIFSLLMLVTGAAPVLAPLLGSALLHVMPWRGIFFVLGGIGAVIAAATIRYLPESLPQGRRHSGGLRVLGGTVHRLARDRALVGACLTLALACAAMFTYITLGSFVLQAQFSLTASQFGAVFACNAFGLVIVGQVNARLLHRFRPATLLATALVVLLAATAILVTAAIAGWGLPVLLPALMVAVAIEGAVLPNATAIALSGHAEDAGAASALLGALQFGAGAAAGPIASIGAVNVHSMTVAMLAWAVAAGVVYLAMVSRSSAARENAQEGLFLTLGG